MKTFFEELRRKGLLKGNKVKKDAIFHAAPHQLLEVAETLSDLSAVDNSIENRSTFTYSASLSLSGSKFPCRYSECRIDRASKLAQYAALYADRVYIRNFLADYLSLDKEKILNEDSLRYDFWVDLEILALLQPLIENRKIIVYTNPHNICPCCLAKIAFGDHTAKRFEQQYDMLQKRLNSEISGEIAVTKNDDYMIHLKGPNDLIDHGGIFFHTQKLPITYNSRKRISLQEGTPIKLSQKELAKSGALNGLLSEAQNDFQFNFATAEIFKTSFLTDRDVHVSILNAINEDSAITRRNQIAERHLTTFVPFIEDISVKDIITLRAREENSFILFRQSLNKAIDEYKKTDNNFSEQTAKAIFADIIAPELAKLDMKVSSAKKDLIKSSRRKALGWIGAISFGIYTGIVPTELSAAASALGLTKVLSDYLEAAMIRSDTEENIKNENLYFLWKVSKLDRKRTREMINKIT